MRYFSAIILILAILGCDSRKVQTGYAANLQGIASITGSQFRVLMRSYLFDNQIIFVQTVAGWSTKSAGSALNCSVRSILFVSDLFASFSIKPSQSLHLNFKTDNFIEQSQPEQSPFFLIGNTVCLDQVWAEERFEISIGCLIFRRHRIVDQSSLAVNLRR